MSFVVGILVGFAAASFCAQAEVGAAREYTILGPGKYVNQQYAYQVVVPKGAVATRIAAPAPNHGINVRLKDRSQDRVWVDGKYDALNQRDLDSIAKWYSQTFVGCRVIEIMPARLGGLDAKEVKLEGFKADSEWHKARFVVAYRRLPQGVGIIYLVALGLRGPNPAASKMFADIARSFELTNLP